MIENLEVNILRFQILAVFASLFYLGFIVYLIKTKKLREDYSLLWLGVGALFLVLAVWRQGLDYIAIALGIAYPPAALFFLLIGVLFFISIQFSIIISKQSNRITKLTQEQSILRHRLERLERARKKEGVEL